MIQVILKAVEISGIKRATVALALGLMAGLVILTACGDSDSSTPAEGSTPSAGATGGPAVFGPYESQFGKSSYFLTNQRWIEGLHTEELDLEDIDAVFWYVFSRLPDQVTVYPSENYYYYAMYVNGKQLWGNIRLPSGRRERGVLSFAYFEFVEFPSVPGTGLSRAKFFTQGDGLLMNEQDPFTWDVSYNNKTVRFHLNQLSQEPPTSFPLRDDEVFVERTLDESGYHFFLLFNEDRNYFFWVLNEEDGYADDFDSIAEDIVVGKRSGFAFWVDREHGDRKILAAIRSISQTRNDYYDGPFDQLADNYADETKIAEYMVKWNPALEGRIDKYGYYTDTERALRVAISAYDTYFTRAEIEQLIEGAKVSQDPYQYIARGGVPLPVTPTPESEDLESAEG